MSSIEIRQQVKPGPKGDIVGVYREDVSASTQRRANAFYYGLLERVKKATLDPELHTEQLMFAFPDYAEAVRKRLEKGHTWEQIIRDEPETTIVDVLSNSHTLEDNLERFRHRFGRPFIPSKEETEEETIDLGNIGFDDFDL